MAAPHILCTDCWHRRHVPKTYLALLTFLAIAGLHKLTLPRRRSDVSRALPRLRGSRALLLRRTHCLLLCSCLSVALLLLPCGISHCPFFALLSFLRLQPATCPISCLSSCSLAVCRSGVSCMLRLTSSSLQREKSSARLTQLSQRETNRTTRHPLLSAPPLSICLVILILSISNFNSSAVPILLSAHTQRERERSTSLDTSWRHHCVVIASIRGAASMSASRRR